MIVRSGHLPALSAASTPKALPMARATISEPNTIDSVTGMRSRSSVVISSPLNQFVPRSPTTALFSQSQYCTTSGRSMPSSARFSASDSRSASSPMMVAAGSTGLSWAKKNTSVATMSISGIAARIRLTSSRST